jgi:inhibitor of cysteine peptidase
MFKKYFWGLVVIFSVTASGCGAPVISSSAVIQPQSLVSAAVAPEQLELETMSQQKSTNPLPVKLTEEQNGGFVALIVNDVVSIKIDGNPSTGYVWEVENLDINLLLQVGDVESISNNNLPGSGSFFTFTFKAVGTGVTHLRLIYYRPFETQTPPLRIFDVTVDIQ